MKTVKEMSQLSGISVRTLHYYDEIKLLTPTYVAENGYRYYDDEAFARLQEILLFRELEFPLKTIKEIVDKPDYDRKFALAQQIQLLELKKQHLEAVIAHAKRLQEGGDMMTFTAYDASEVHAFEKEARQRWGQTAAFQAFESKEDTDYIKISQEMAKLIEAFIPLKELPVSDAKVQEQVVRFQDYISENFYPCNKEVLASLAQMYVEDNRFTQFIDTIGGSGMAHFISQAFLAYCQD